MTVDAGAWPRNGSAGVGSAGVGSAGVGSTGVGSTGRRQHLAASVAAAVDGVRGARRTAGTGVATATQHAGGSVVGVRLSTTSVAVRIVAGSLPLDTLAEEVRRAARAALEAAGADRPVDVIVDDLDDGVLGAAVP